VFTRLGFLRENQRIVVNTVVNKLVENVPKSILFMLKAPTGFGKTLVALSIAYMLHNEYGFNVITFVRTRNQLSRYVEDCVKFFKTLPKLRLNKELVCITKLFNCKQCRYGKEIEVDELMSLLSWKNIYDPYSHELLKEFREMKLCPYYTWCSISSFVTVCTYPYLSNPSLRKEVFNNERPNFVIIDEAHNLENLINLETSSTLITRFYTTIEIESTKFVQKFHISPSDLFTINDTARKLRDEWIKIFDKCRRSDYIVLNLDWVKQNYLSTLNLWNLIKDMTFQLHLDNVIDAFYEWKNIIEHVINYELNILQMVKDDVPPKYVFRTFDFSKIGFLLSEFKHVLLMSGTLPSKWYVKSIWGIKHDKIVSIEFPEVLKNLNVVYVNGVTSLYKQRSTYLFAKYGFLITKIFEIACKNVLCFFPSYEFMFDTLPFIKIHEESIIYDVKTISQVLDKLLNGKSRYLICDVFSGKLAEGIEFLNKETNELLISDVVLVGIPYPKYDKFTRDLLSRFEEKGISSRLYMFEKAWISVRQAIGRVTRGKGIVNIWFLDDRYVNDELWKNKLSELHVHSRKLIHSDDLLDDYVKNELQNIQKLEEIRRKFREFLESRKFEEI